MKKFRGTALFALFLFLPFALQSAEDSLTVLEVQGNVTAKTPTDRRWSPVLPGTVLRSGDEIRSGVRGANAVRIQLPDETTLVLGPASSGFVGDDHQFRLRSGELAKPAATNPGECLLIKADSSRISIKEPAWLKGFNGVNTTESTGSLLAKVDGRDVALTVGYHHVTIEIRDQIARTTIEQSFVNHTKFRTEGVFYFPLPQEASIAGFGMWIDGELVEADVIEKQRAREIYETILRERRDPGLLEWTGGNIFKARVFPILPHSEKRVKIVYTEVLPLAEDGTFRYAYGLRSDLLRENPVRDLQIDVSVFSESGVESAACTSHPNARVDLTENAAHIQFSAEEFTPESDFEISVNPRTPEAPFTLIPHRRGEDGYFLLSFTPPGTQEGAIDHSTVLNRSDDEPLRLLLLCDTSGSIDPQQRKIQSRTVSAILSQLGEADRFNLATCDVGTHWLSEEIQSVSGPSTEEALEFLEKRISLGWSDLRKSLAEVGKKVKPETQVIYIGDGIPVTAQTDPNAFAASLSTLKMPEGIIAPGSSFEPVAMNAIAALGKGGPVRVVGDSDEPSAIAAALLNDILHPGFRDMTFAIEGEVKTARVYPDTIANAAPGRQQFVVGRYLPTGKNQSGDLVVTAGLGENRVTWKYPITFPALGADHEGGDTGNSFIPRLWARKYLDVLLAQGAAAEIQREIVDLSVEYKIMTPYTSFLVLESEADRERFGVKRRFQMRDGERFFSDGRESANFELVAQQMRRASEWRNQLQQQALADLANMGRNPQQVQRHRDDFGFDWKSNTHTYDRVIRRELPLLGISGVPSVGSRFGDLNISVTAGGSFNFSADSAWELPMQSQGLALSTLDDISFFDVEDKVPFLGETVNTGRLFSPNASGGKISAGYMTDFIFLSDTYNSAAESNRRASFAEFQYSNFAKVGHGGAIAVGGGFFGKSSFVAPGSSIMAQFPAEPGTTWSTYFDSPETKPATWSEEVLTLAKSVARLGHFIEGGVHWKKSTTTRDLRRDRVKSILESEVLVSAEGGSWWRRDASPGSDGTWQLLHEDSVTAFNSVSQLGRKWPAEEIPASLLLNHFKSDLSFDLVSQHSSLDAAASSPDTDPENRQWLTFSRNGKPVQRYLIDTKRNVILRMEQVDEKEGWKLRSRTTEFIEFRGLTCPAVIEWTDSEDQTRTIKYTYADYDDSLFADKETEAKSGITIGELPKLSDAHRRTAGESDTEPAFEVWIVMTEHFFSRQQWDRAEVCLNSLEKLLPADSASSELAMRSLWLHFYRSSGNTARMQQMLSKEIEELRDSPNGTVAGFLRAEFISEQYVQRYQLGESLALLDELKPLFLFSDEKNQWRDAEKIWKQQRGAILGYWQGSNVPERIAWMRDMALQYPLDSSVVLQYLQVLIGNGETLAARGVYEIEEGRDFWNETEKWQFRVQIARTLESEGRYGEVVALLEDHLDSARLSEYHAAQYLKALAWSGETDRYRGTLTRWLEDYVETKDTPTDVMKARALGAMRRLGEYQSQVKRIPERWHDLLKTTAITCAKDPDKAVILQSIVGNYGFRELEDLNREVTGDIGQWLLENVATISPAHLGQVLPHFSLKNGETMELGEGLLERWRAEKNVEEKQALDHVIFQRRAEIFDEDQSAKLDFLRERIEGEDDSVRRLKLQEDLFTEALTAPVETELARELFGLIEAVAHEDEDVQVRTQVSWLIQLNDRISKFAALKKREESKKPVEEMTNAEQKAFSEALKSAGVAEVMAHLDHIAEDDAWSALFDWIEMERIYFQSQVKEGKELAPLLTRTLALLDELDDSEQAIAKAKEDRLITTASHLAAKTHRTDPKLTERLQAFLDRGLNEADDETKSQWRQRILRLLLAIGDVDALEKTLLVWSEEDTYEPAWRTALAYLYLETDRLEDAETTFRFLEEKGLLGGEESVAYAELLQALGKKEQSLSTQRDGISQSRLNLLNNHLNALRNGGAETVGTLTEKDIEKITELLHRSPNPANYIYSVRELYRETKDPRLLRAVVGSLIGNSAQEVYQSLNNLDDFIHLVEEESSVDEAMSEIAKIRKADDSLSALDERALALLESILKQRAAEVMNQPRQHIPTAVAAIRSATERDFEPGERVLMAGFLGGLSKVTADEVEAAVVAAFTRLKNGEPDSFQQLSIATHRAQWDLQQTDFIEGASRLSAALSEAMKGRNGQFWSEMVPALKTLNQLNDEAGHFAEGEKQIAECIANAVNEEAKHQALTEASANYLNAFKKEGTTSLGVGKAQYVPARDWMIGQFREGRTARRKQEFVDQLADLHYEAHRKKIEEAMDDLKAFGVSELIPLLEVGANGIAQMIGRVGSRLGDVGAKRDALEFFVLAMEKQPGWLVEEQRQSLWQSIHYPVVRRRHELRTIPEDLSDRLFRVLSGVLENHLQFHSDDRLEFCDLDDNRAWKERMPDFQKVVEAFLGKRMDSPETVSYVANLLADNFRDYDRAAKALLELEKSGTLDPNGLVQLGGYLDELERWEESARVHRISVNEKTPEAKSRLRLVRALFHLGKEKAMRGEIEKAFESTATETDLAQLAEVAAEVKESESAVSYFEAAIRKAEATRPNRGIGEGALSSYYRKLAGVHSELGQTKEAVDAASAAIVAWGPKLSERKRALSELRGVLKGAKELDAFSKEVADDALESRLENPVLRKALGMVYLEKNEPEKAVGHLRVAVEMAGNDKETQAQLIQALDDLGQGDEAREQLLEAIRQSPREFELIHDLRKRFLEANDQGEAERAATQLVEAVPNESEGHHELAKVRMETKNWDAAQEHWKRVAELRKLEPTGLIGQIRTHMAAGQTQKAKAILEELDSKRWPDRFRGEIKNARDAVKEL